VRLYIMRHGPAEDRAASGRDFDRALTASGRDRVKDVARALAAEGEAPHLILSSPLVRALQTAEIVAAVTKLEGAVLVRRGLEPGAQAYEVAQECLAGEATRVMLVGHEPDFSELAARLSGRAFPAGLQKAMVVGLATHDDAPTRVPLALRFVLDPKSLAWRDRQP
jgi:phosphohistidine phosphatase